MEKAYDLKVLGQMIVQEAKKEGFTIAEEAVEKLAVSVLEATVGWLLDSAEVSETQADDIIMPFVSHLQGIIKEQIEKIDLDGDAH